MVEASETARFASRPVLTAPSFLRATKRIVQNGNSPLRRRK